MAGDVRRTEGRGALKVGLIAVVTLVAFESLAVITILPDIEDDLGGIAWYGWVTTAFFLGTMIGIVFAGDQADAGAAGRTSSGCCCSPSGSPSAGWPRRCRCWWPGVRAGLRRRRRAGDRLRRHRAGLPRGGRPRMFAVLSTAWVVPGLVGPVLAERVSDPAGWRWVFLGLLPLVAVAGSIVVPAMVRLGPLRGAARRSPSLRRRHGRGGASGGRSGARRGRLHGVTLAARPGDRCRPRRRARPARAG